MITLTDSLKLAYTKIRTRKIRLFVVVFVASLLFSGLVAGTMIVTGSLQSFRAFSDSGFANRYILAGTYMDEVFTSSDGPDYSDLIPKAEQLYKEEVAQRQAEAAQLGIEYQEDPMLNPIYEDGKQKRLNDSTPIAIQLLTEREKRTPSKRSLEAFKQQLDGADGYYTSRTMAAFGRSDQAGLSVIEDGKEKFNYSNDRYYSFGMTSGLKGMTTDWTLMDNELLEPFLLPNQSLEIGKDGSIPIIASYSATQEVLGLTELSETVSNEEKRDRLLEVREKITGSTFQICYRNSSSYQQMQEAANIQAAIESMEDEPEYTKPSLVTKQSETPCVSPELVSDTRSQTEKDYAAKQAEFNKTFGEEAPVSKILTFRIVGITPDRKYPDGFNIASILSSFLLSTSGVSWASPSGVAEAVPEVEGLFAQSFSPYNMQTTYYAEYTSADAAREAYKFKGCVPGYTGMQIEEGQEKCNSDGRTYRLNTFGSASLAIDEFEQGFRKVQLIVAAVVATVGALVLMGMVGRIIADARKETAIFRALGASRLSIAQIYVTYTLYLALLIIAIAFVVGLGLALWMDGKYSADTGISMALFFNTTDLTMPFRFYGVNLYDIGLIAAVIIVASVVSASVPIAHNIQRNPIRDMREE